MLTGRVGLVIVWFWVRVWMVVWRSGEMFSLGGCPLTSEALVADVPVRGNL